ncbi:oligomeric golgi complex component, COG2-domain-containing protein [Lipomyces arxii]|uniref:oligomeric golgi complex component, COG2-domain-containing protein n=1 Tax=Lipomyces arxii TaxID=56418 RepID=UPI0034CD2E68
MSSTSSKNSPVDYFTQQPFTFTAINGQHGLGTALQTEDVSPQAMTNLKNGAEHYDDSLYDVEGHESDYDDNGLPFAKPIQRSAFSTPEVFDPDAFLVAQHRYQRLEDLHSQLTSWSSQLQKELVELINRDYADFIGLGKSVSGGAGKAEDIKLIVIGFRREIEGISTRLKGVMTEMNDLLIKKRKFREKENLGQSLIFCTQRLQELELALHIQTPDETILIEDTYESLLSKLKSLSGEFMYMRITVSKLPQDHPYLYSLEPRIAKVKTKLLSELKASIKDQEADGKLALLQCIVRITELDKVKK